MADELLFDFRGLVTAPGMLARNPASCTVARNVLFEAPGTLRCRRGFSRLSDGFGGPIWKMASSRTLGTNLLVNAGTATEATALRYGDGTAAFSTVTAIGSLAVTNQPGTRLQTTQMQGNTYLTSDEGSRRLETDMTLYVAGMPAGGQLNHQVSGSPPLVAGTILADGYAFAYRVVWGKKDQQGVEMVGPPTGRTVVRNSNGTPGYSAGNARDVFVYVSLPKALGTTATALTTSYFYRVYRTGAFNLTVSAPNDEMRLVYEASLTSTDITNGYISFTDTVPDTLRGAYLNTNPNSGEFGPNGERGIIMGDFAPPRARDVATFADCVWYANTASKPRTVVTLLTVPADGDTVTIDAVAYTFRNAPALAGEVQIASASFTATSVRVEQTAQNLAAYINGYSTNTSHYAYYISGPTEGSSLVQLPGQILIEARSQGAAFSVAASAATWRPAINSASANISSEGASNQIAFSKPQRGDAVPPTNLFQVGPSAAEVMRIVPLSNRLLVFTNYGIYQVTGTNAGDFSLREFDLTFHLLARETVVTCEGRVYAWCVEGIIEVDEGGVRVISTPVEPTVQKAVADVADNDEFDRYAFAVAYYREHRVQFFYPSSVTAANKSANFWLTFDVRTRAWSGVHYFTYRNADGFQDSRSCGVVRFEDDLLFLGEWNASGADAFVYKERRGYAATDYQDTASNGVTAVVEPFVTLNASCPEAAGAMHWQEAIAECEASETFSGLTVPTAMRFSFSPIAGTTNITVTISNASPVVRCPVPLDARRSNRLTVSLSRGNSTVEYWALNGLVLRFRPGTRLTARAP